jgi:dolichyl-phosphate-mannose-protein mannosyltransferase
MQASEETAVSLDHPVARKILYALAGAAALAGLWFRFWHLGAIKTPIFDEVYFPVFANDFLHRQIAFDVHPPLGKFFIAIGIKLFGNVPLGWRVVPAVFGVINIAVLAWIWQKVGQTAVGTALIVLFASLDGLLLVYSRTGLIDGILLCMILLSIACAYSVQPEGNMLWLATAIGAAAAVKWIGIGVLVPVAYIIWRKGRLPELALSWVWSVWVYLFVVVAGEVVGNVAHPFLAAWQWHVQALQYQLTLTATHPYASPWWSWPLMLRPVLLYYQGIAGGATEVITAMGNPVLWFLADAAVLLSGAFIIRQLIRKDRSIADHPLVPLLVGFLAFWLPFALIHRVLFLYHYLPAYCLALLMLVWWMDWLWRRNPWVTLIFVVVILAVSIYFLPFAIGTPLSPLWLARHVWYHKWIY